MGIKFIETIQEKYNYSELDIDLKSRRQVKLSENTKKRNEKN